MTFLRSCHCFSYSPSPSSSGPARRPRAAPSPWSTGRGREGGATLTSGTITRTTGWIATPEVRRGILLYFLSILIGMGAITGTGDFDSGPCVGVCYYIKKRGIKLNKVMKERLKSRKPCIGLCYLKKMRNKEKNPGENWYIWNLTCCCSRHHYFQYFYFLPEKNSS